MESIYVIDVMGLGMAISLALLRKLVHSSCTVFGESNSTIEHSLKDKDGTALVCGGAGGDDDGADILVGQTSTGVGDSSWAKDVVLRSSSGVHIRIS